VCEEDDQETKQRDERSRRTIHAIPFQCPLSVAEFGAAVGGDPCRLVRQVKVVKG
jgi:hypothetical protein